MALTFLGPKPAAAWPTPAIVQETQVSAAPTGASGRAWEPIVATHPTDPSRIAVVYPRGSAPIVPVIRVSRDGGQSWHTAGGRPGGGGIHPVIAWGPGPQPGSGRLYYANMTGGKGALFLATAFSDDEGETWSRLRVERSTAPWIGGFPDITVDTDPTSPNYGVVYVAYNWPASKATGPGLHILASADFGRTWRATEIPVAEPPPGYDDSWRIGYRLRTAADGSAFVAFYQADMREWDSTNIFAKGGAGNLGRIGFSVARFAFDRVAGVFTLKASVTAAVLPETAWNMGARPAGTNGGLSTDPQWSVGLDIDRHSGRIYLAIGADGGVRIYRSDDRGLTWTFVTLPAAANVDGRPQWSWKPDVVVGRGFVMVTLHTLDRARSGATVGNAYSISYDQGLTWSEPLAVNDVRWRAADLASGVNGPGLRDRAALTSDGTHVFFVYGDGRLAAGSGTGGGAIFGALIAANPAPPSTGGPFGHRSRIPSSIRQAVN